MGETLTVGDDALEDSATDDLSEGGLCLSACDESIVETPLTGSLDESHADIIDPEGGSVRRHDCASA